MQNSLKFPRIPHLPQSPGKTNDDKVIKTLDNLYKIDLLVTEKLDGSNVCLERTGVFARSYTSSPSHPSFNKLKEMHACVSHLIPYDTQIFCEYLFAKHSIYYDKLSSFLYIIGVRTNDLWVEWDRVLYFSSLLSIPTVPVIKSTTFYNEQEIEDFIKYLKITPRFGPEAEGFVVRPSSYFSDQNFDTLVAKYVRENHVKTDEHWAENWERNKLI